MFGNILNRPRIIWHLWWSWYWKRKSGCFRFYLIFFSWVRRDWPPDQLCQISLITRKITNSNKNKKSTRVCSSSLFNFILSYKLANTPFRHCTIDEQQLSKVQFQRLLQFTMEKFKSISQMTPFKKQHFQHFFENNNQLEKEA